MSKFKEICYYSCRVKILIIEFLFYKFTDQVSTQDFLVVVTEDVVDVKN